MTKADTNPVRVPTRDELLALVVSGPSPGKDSRTEASVPPAPVAEVRPCEHPPERLSLESEKVLRHVAINLDRNLGITDHCREVGVRSGSVEKRVVAELHARGYIRLERKGRMKAVHLYPSAWTYLGLDPPTAEGRGGALHRRIVARVAASFKGRGYDVRIEHETGTSRKRVDLVVFGPDRVVGVEVEISESRQALKNLRADLDTGVLDLVLVVSPNPALLGEIRRGATADPVLGTRLGRMCFVHFTDDEMP